MASVQFTVGELTFEWDARTAQVNRRKHGVTFEEAATLLLDVHAQVFDDPDSDPAEPRFLIVGLSASRRAVVVVHVERGSTCASSVHVWRRGAS